MPVGPAVAADGDARALFLAERDVLLDPLLLALGDERTDLGGRRRPGRRPSAPPTIADERVDDLVVALVRLARMRVCATQAWPLFMSDANFRPSTVAARSASSRMIAADLPPSSRLHALELLAADRRRCGGRPRSNR